MNFGDHRSLSEKDRYKRNGSTGVLQNLWRPQQFHVPEGN